MGPFRGHRHGGSIDTIAYFVTISWSVCLCVWLIGERATPHQLSVPMMEPLCRRVHAPASDAERMLRRTGVTGFSQSERSIPEQLICVRASATPICLFERNYWSRGCAPQSTRVEPHHRRGMYLYVRMSQLPF